VLADVQTGNVLAYVGNATPLAREHGGEVDVITSPRSSGSILKPFLFAAMLEEGRIMPTTLLPDVPTLIQGFAPQNFSKTYEGAVPANEALVRSLNVPAVHLLKEYRYEKFHRLLQQVGVTTLHYPADHYGLALILGGAETTLWDITGSYASMARQVQSRSSESYFFSLSYVSGNSQPVAGTDPQLSNAVLYQTLDALTEVNRPGEEVSWKKFANPRKVAWKTGTSFGHRDGWAVGVTPQFVVGVWVGNADGEGRPGLTGADAAAPLMFDIFSALPVTGWFEPPLQEMKQVKRCMASGMRFSDHCSMADTAWVATAALESPACTYHKVVHLSRSKQYRVNQDCYPGMAIQTQPWFVLPAIQEYYYRKAHPAFKALPPMLPGCGTATNLVHMDFVYPKPNARIFIPSDLDGTSGKSVFEVAHRHPERKVFWHLDDQYLGLTSGNHVLALNPTRGKHTLLVVDEAGEALEAHFEVISDR
jgi:penicillin-binding protein 1C